MKAPGEDTEPERAAELTIAITTFTNTLQAASKIYSGSRPEQARGAIRIALHGVVTLISNLYPNEPAFLAPSMICCTTSTTWIMERLQRF
jgi:hypothetical protein